VEESARVVSDAGDRFVVGTLADVTPLRALEEHASELSAIFESVFHTSSLAVAVFDEHDRLMMANETFCTLVGFDPESILGVAVAMFGPEGELENLLGEARTGAAGSAPMPSLALHLRSRKGTLQRVQTKHRPLRQRSGKAWITLIGHQTH
jgi:PAS domain S-box-containing protein